MREWYMECKGCGHQWRGKITDICPQCKDFRAGHKGSSESFEHLSKMPNMEFKPGDLDHLNHGPQLRLVKNEK